MAWNSDTIQAVWNKATTVPGYDPAKYRKDQCSAWILRDEYGNRKSVYGWEIDHITCVANGGSDNLFNLRPLQWQNNCSKSDGRLVCTITPSGDYNVSV